MTDQTPAQQKAEEPNVTIGDQVFVHFQGWFGRKARKAVVLRESPKRYRVKYADTGTVHYVPKYAITITP